MTTYQIANSASSIVLGTFVAETKEQALDMLAIQIGYTSYADVPEEIGGGEDIVVEEVTTAELVQMLNAAAVAFRDEEDGEPGVLYVQLSRSFGWDAAFAELEDHREMLMTRWSTDADVLEIYEAALAGDTSKVQAYAADIETGWDSDWTND